MAKRTQSPGTKASKAKAKQAAASKTGVLAAGERDSLVKLRAHVEDIEGRLKRANASTRGSVTALKRAFTKLNENSGGAPMSPELATHLDSLSQQLTGLINQTRQDVASDLQMVLDDPRLETLKTAITAANRRLTRAEGQQANAISMINQQIADLALAIDSRIKEETAARTQADQALEVRLDDIEEQSTEAIKLIGTKVITLTDELEKRADGEYDALREQVAAQIVDQTKSLEDHKFEVGRRIEAIEEEFQAELPSYERRIEKLQTRLEVLEAGQVYAQKPEHEAAPPPFDAPPVQTELPSKPTGLQAYDEVEHEDIVAEAPVEEAAEPAKVFQLVNDDAFAPIDPEVIEVVTPPPNPYSAPAEAAPSYAQPVVQEYVPEPQAPTQSYELEQRYAGDQQYAPQQPFAEQLPPVTTNPPPMQMSPPYEQGQMPSHAPFNMETGAFEQPAAFQQDQMVGQGYEQGYGQGFNQVPAYGMPDQGQQGAEAQMAPPPFTQPLQDETMVEARPGADTQKKRKSKRNKPKRQAGRGISQPVKIAALMTGVAVVGLLGAKTFMPALIGGKTSEPVLSASEPLNEPSAGVTYSSNSQDQQPAGRPIESLDVVGNYAAASRAPNFDANAVGAGGQTLEQAASAGNAIAQFQLGLSNLEAGQKKEAVKLIRLSANQNQGAAQYRLAKLYEAGDGVEKNMTTAKKLLEQAATNGNRIAMHDLGHYYATGTVDGVANIEIAATWFEKAAKLDVLDSQFNLGVLYQEGSGVEKSMAESYYWYSIAGQKGDKVARNRADQIAQTLQKSELANTQAKLKAYTPQPFDEAANGVFRNTPWAPATQRPAKASSEDVSVANAQKMLNDLGYSVGRPDGSMGPKTRNAIISFEKANGMPETGRVNATLLERLERAARA